MPHQKTQYSYVWPASVDPSRPGYLSYKYDGITSSYGHPAMSNQHLFYSPTPLTPPPFMFNSLKSVDSIQDFQSQIEQRFSLGLFDDVYPSMQRGNASRAQFSWPHTLDIMIASWLQIVVNASCTAGFSTIGAFLFALFTKSKWKYTGHALLTHCISAFMRNSSQVAGIVNLLYKHSDAVSYHNQQVDEPHFTLPQYALAPTLHLQRVLPTPLPNSTKNALINWALSVVMDHVNIKSTQLAECPTIV
ncbi:hypothetical protein ARMGADRAFT_1037736 [Armillaria gallica]|uniref:Uncharacterized protein n=1 Tax=Armillaria gallica TaxID=47427 RepID=A0A2H3CIH5_ARMGA|nr:hypothetical protein ARMGADRAFT_1041057 [Armillaria gallica]PBK82909.1 hypothetical protein ARMGADRAFT_1038207 [Armillaria gallica]PBK83560.1 hypothetical protein ARMGADRAFT_1037736 [Armillaria gallica]